MGGSGDRPPGAPEILGVPTCPRCGGHLLPFAVPEGEALGCDACRGVWVDDQAFAALRQGMEDEVVGVAEVLQALSHGSSARAPVTCPTCHRLLLSTEVSRVRIELCPAHGTWIDREEVEIVADAVADASSGAPSSHDWAKRITGDLGVLPDGLVTALGTIIAVGDHARRGTRRRF